MSKIIEMYRAGLADREADLTKRATQDALGMWGTDPQGAIKKLFPYNPTAALQLQEYADKQATRDRSRLIGTAMGAGNTKEAQRLAYEAGDIDTGSAIAKLVAEADEAGLKRLKARSMALAQVGAAARDLRDGQGNPDIARRKALIQSARPYLLQSGYTDEEIDGFEPTDQALETALATGLDLDKYLDNRRSDLKADREWWDTRQDNARDDKRLGFEGQRVALATDANRRGWASHDARMKGLGGYGYGDPSGTDSEDLWALSGIPR